MISIHLATLLFGLAGLFGKWVGLSSAAIVLGRVVFAGLFLSFFLKRRKEKAGLLKKSDAPGFALQGALLAFHWGAFFEAIKLSSVALGLFTFATFPFFTVFLEALLERRPVRKGVLFVALLTLFGVYLLVPHFDLSSASFQGAMWGLASGGSFSVLCLANRRFAERYPGAVVALWQDGFAVLFLLPVVLVGEKSLPTMADLALLFVLGTLLTGVSHTLFIDGMKKVSATRASIVASLEPLYGSFAAYLLLNEVPKGQTLLGGCLICGAASWATCGRHDG